jgi:hypothetical protein
MKNPAPQFLAAFLATLLQPHAQPPDTLYIPVTYYDYRVDGSNPDFAPDIDYRLTSTVVVPGMVDTLLGPNRLPVRGDTCRFSFGIERWFAQVYSRPAMSVPAVAAIERMAFRPCVHR